MLNGGTGLTFTSSTGGPITDSGTFTLGGTLDAANGGTGLTSLGAANTTPVVDAGGTSLEYIPEISRTDYTQYIDVPVSPAASTYTLDTTNFMNSTSYKLVVIIQCVDQNGTDLNYNIWETDRFLLPIMAGIDKAYEISKYYLRYITIKPINNGNTVTITAADAEAGEECYISQVTAYRV